MNRNNTAAAISRILLAGIAVGVFLFSGCREETATVTATNEDPGDAKVRLEMAQIMAKAESLAAVDPVPSRKSRPDNLEEIEALRDETERSKRYADIARQKLFKNECSEAAEVAVKIPDAEMRDRLLEDIARFQVQDAFQMYESVPYLSMDGMAPEEILAVVREAAETARKIGDPLIRAETYGNIALFRLSMKDRVGTDRMMSEAAEACRASRTTGIRKARALYFFARWFLQRENKEQASLLCREAEAALEQADRDVESALLRLEIASSYVLLGDFESAKESCGRVESDAGKLAEPRTKATVLLRLAEALLVVRVRDKSMPLAQRLLSIKAVVLEAVELIGKGTFDTSSDKTDLPDREKLSAMKNDLLRKVAVMQIWGSSLEDVWDTVEEIDPGSDRDDALVSTVEMMISTRSTEFARDWAEEISDPEKKRAVLRKLEK